jgi:hypothetical protein
MAQYLNVGDKVVAKKFAKGKIEERVFEVASATKTIATLENGVKLKNCDKIFGSVTVEQTEVDFDGSVTFKIIGSNNSNWAYYRS